MREENNGAIEEALADPISLPVVVVWATNRAGTKRVKANALVDTGSTSTFCTMTLAKQLGLELSPIVLPLRTLNGVQSACQVSACEMMVAPLEDPLETMALV